MIELAMVTVPEGFFLRGEPLERTPEPIEAPQIRIWVDTYQIQKFPITVRDWFHFFRNATYDWPEAEWGKSMERAGLSIPLSPDLPITYVSWHDAQAFANWLTSVTKRSYKLPSEVQWEKACRGTEGQRFPWGNSEPDWRDELVRLEDAYGSFAPIPVGQQSQFCSPFGCEEMWCNVSEWCSDWFLVNYSNPDDPDNDAPGVYKAFRGGNLVATGWPRCCARGHAEPGLRDPNLGFRLVLA